MPRYAVGSTRRLAATQKERPGPIPEWEIDPDRSWPRFRFASPLAVQSETCWYIAVTLALVEIWATAESCAIGSIPSISP